MPYAYDDRNIRLFEVYGSMKPDPDGSWDSWTLLLDGEIKKPSGLPIGINSDEDIKHWKAGDEVEFPDDIPYVRYLRFKVKEVFSKQTQFITDEMKFWG